MISAADVLAVATPSWKTKGLRSAKDLLQAVIAVVVEEALGFFAETLAALLLVSRREVVERSQIEEDVRFDGTRRESEDVVIMVVMMFDVPVGHPHGGFVPRGNSKLLSCCYCVYCASTPVTYGMYRTTLSLSRQCAWKFYLLE